MLTKKPGTPLSRTTYSMRDPESKLSKPRTPPKPLSELSQLLEEPWADEDSRVSVTFVAPAVPTKVSSIPPAKLARRVATIVGAIAAGLIAAWTALHEAGILK